MTGKKGVVIPTYKESDNIARLIGALLEQIPACRIIVVDDSPDMNTVKAVTPLCNEQVSILHRTEKGGRGSAVLDGLRQLLADGCEYVAEMDADFSHDPRQLPELFSALHAMGAQMAIASRYLPESRIVNWPWSRLLFSKAANLLAKTLLGVPIHDYTNGYRVYHRDAGLQVVETCGKLGRGFIPLSETLVNLYYRGFRIGEVPTHFINRLRGESSVTSREIRDALSGLVRIYGLKRKLRASGATTAPVSSQHQQPTARISG